MAVALARIELHEAIETAVTAQHPNVQVLAYPVKTGKRSRHPAIVFIDSIVYGTLEGSDIFEAEIHVDLYAGADMEHAYTLGDQLLDIIDLALPKNWLKLEGWDKDDQQITGEPATITYTSIAYAHPSTTPEPVIPDYILLDDTSRMLISFAPADAVRIN